jgi:cysteine desulfurase
VKEQIYLDYMATTPVDPRVAEAMQACLCLSGCFGNPASNTHRFGYEAKRKVEHARAQVASLINAEPKEIIWTSGATESDNLAIIGAAKSYQRKGKHIITMATEHKAVLDTCAFLETEGYEITYLKPESNGLLDLGKLEVALRDDTLLVSIMHVNNETGVIQNLQEISEVVKAKGVLLHTDAAQSNGKLKIDVKTLPVDMISLCAHKVYGPKGIGALYVRSKPQIRLEPMIYGGKHERGMRSGTLATHQIVGMGEAFELAANEMEQDRAHAQKIASKLYKLLTQSTKAALSCHDALRVPNCLNLIFEGIRSEALMLATPNLAFSSGSACNSATPKPSHVLTAMGIETTSADCAVRISVGRFTTEQDVQNAGEQLIAAWERLKKISMVGPA